MFNRADMRRFSFEPPSPIDQPPPRDCTASIIGVEHCAAKRPVAEGAIDEGLYQGALNFVGGLLLTKPIKRFGIAHARECVVVGQTERNDASEVRIREGTDGCLRIG